MSTALTVVQVQHPPRAMAVVAVDVDGLIWRERRRHLDRARQHVGGSRCGLIRGDRRRHGRERRRGRRSTVDLVAPGERVSQCAGGGGGKSGGDRGETDG